MADVERELQEYAARRVGGTSPQALALCAAAAKQYRATLKAMQRFNPTSPRFWSSLDVSAAVAQLRTVLRVRPIGPACASNARPCLAPIRLLAPTSRTPALPHPAGPLPRPGRHPEHLPRGA